MLHFIKETIVNILCYLFRLFPLRNSVIFDNFCGKGFGDDPKYIALELHKKAPNVKIIWQINNENYDLPEWIIPVKIRSIRSLFELCRAKIWVDNVKNNIKPNKRKGQFYIQTWHATLGLKKIEQDASFKNYGKIAERDASLTDLMYTNNDIRYNQYKTRFWYNGKVIKSDVPRISILKNPPAPIIQHVRAFFNLNKNQRIVLYAPTFRNSGDFNIYKFDYQKIINELNVKFNQEFVMLIRLHPKISNMHQSIQYDNNVIDATNYPDMQELLACSDVLITDFSASQFDFSLLKKPLFLFAQDYDVYMNTDRGMYLDINNLPFSFSKNLDELILNIRNFNAERFSQKCESFFQSIGMKDEGNGSANIADIIIKYLCREESYEPSFTLS